MKTLFLFLAFFSSAAVFSAEVSSLLLPMNILEKMRETEMLKEEENFCFSPFSLSIALGMTKEGAQGETRKEMDLVLSRDPNLEAGKSLGIESANALFLHRPEAKNFKESFTKLVQIKYSSDINWVDFLKSAPAIKTINSYVNQKTHQHIPEVLPKNALNKETKMVLVNALYLKSSWSKKFKKELTTKKDFNLVSKKKIKVQMMSDKGQYSYIEGEWGQLLSLPFNDDVSMWVLLPGKNVGASDLEKMMDEAVPRTVNLQIPKFKINGKMKGKEIFSSLGMSLAFSDQADFSGMSTIKPGLKISEIFHQASVEVNEDGAEAAAATAVVMTRKGKAMKEDIKEFIADRPFLFFIRDNQKKDVLFLGQVARP
ncbi:MAG: serpin family protein [Bacteriovoracaceae bacterium]